MSSGVMKHVRMMMKQQAQTGACLPKDGDCTIMRETVQKNCAMMATIPGMEYKEEVIGGVACEEVTLGTLTSDDIVFYIHGGAWAAGNAKSSRAFAAMLSADMGMKVYTISYRLAPENLYPAQIDDCMAVYDALVERYPNSKIALIGESAGAHLSLALTHRIKTEGKKMPVAVVVYSPLVDVTGDLEKERAKYYETDVVLGTTTDLNGLVVELCFKDYDLENPYASPLRGNFEGFSPLCVIADSGEALFADYKALVEKATRSGVKIEAKCWDEVFHAFPTMGRSCQESTEAYEMSIAFMKKHFSK